MKLLKYQKKKNYNNKTRSLISINDNINNFKDIAKAHLILKLTESQSQYYNILINKYLCILNICTYIQN